MKTTDRVSLKCFQALLLLTIGFPPGVMGESPTLRMLTLQQALDIAAEKNRDILKAREYRNLVLGRYKEERAAVLPQFSLNVSVSNSFDNTFSALFGGAFSIPSAISSILAGY